MQQNNSFIRDQGQITKVHGGNLESLLKMTIDEVQKLSDEDFDRLLDQAFYSLETEMK